jgi:dipeptide/tripeptide permease
VFLFFPIWNLNVGGIGSVVTNQGAAMITNGVPNDVLSNFSPLTIIVAIPLLTFVVYPTLHRYRIHVGPITRLAFGFFLAMISGIVGTIVQWKVYKLSPCGYYASTCDTVAPISIWWQAPNIVLGALSECFCNVTAYELAYARSPPSMKGLVVAIFLFMNALSNALGEILIPVTKDPWLLWIWGAPAVALALQTIILWVRFKGLNNTMDGRDDPHRSEDEAKSDRRTPTGNTMNV